MPFDNKDTTIVQEQKHTRAAHQGGGGCEQPLHPGNAQVHRHVVIAQPLKMPGLKAFQVIGLDQADGHQGGPGKFRELRKLLLHQVKAVVEHAGEFFGAEDQNRHGQKHDQG